MLGDKLPDAGLKEKYNSEALSFNINLSLFADDTTLIINMEELETGVGRITGEMVHFDFWREDTEDYPHVGMLDGTRGGHQAKNPKSGRPVG